MSDAELLARSARGEERAFELLYERHRNAVYRFAWLLANSVADAEEITQECFLALVRKQAAFDPARSQLRTWLMAVTRNLYYQRCRTAARQTEMAVQMQEPEAQPTIEESLIRDESANVVCQAVAALPASQREAIFLFEFEGLSLAETASVLDIEPNAVKARLYRAREELKRLLVGFPDGFKKVGKETS